MRQQEDLSDEEGKMRDTESIGVLGGLSASKELGVFVLIGSTSGFVGNLQAELSASKDLGASDGLLHSIITTQLGPVYFFLPANRERRPPTGTITKIGIVAPWHRGTCVESRVC